jgi:hypothetical protein
MAAFACRIFDAESLQIANTQPPCVFSREIALALDRELCMSSSGRIRELRCF